MEKNNQFIYFLIIFTHLAITIHAQNPTLITKTCNQTSNYTLCALTLNSDPATANAKDMRDLTMIMLNHVTQKLSDIENHIQGLIRNRQIVEEERYLLNVCDQNYNFLLTNWIVKVKDCLSKRDYQKGPSYVRAYDIGPCRRVREEFCTNQISYFCR